MEILISEKFLFNSNSKLHSFISKFIFRSNSLQISSFIQFSQRKRNLNPKPPNLFSVSASTSTNYGGWEDLNFIEDSKQSGKLHEFQQFLVSIGIDDSKHFFLFLLGFVSALAVSRVRVSSILVFPVAVLVFGVGFSLGFVQSGGLSSLVKEIGGNGSKRRYKEDAFRVSVEKLRTLVALFSELDGKVINMEKDMKGVVKMGEFDKYNSVFESVSTDVLCAKKILEASIVDMDVLIGESKGESVDKEEEKRSSNQKGSVKKRDQGARYFDFLQFVGGMFQENVVVGKPDKAKDISKQESVEPVNLKVMNNQGHSGDVIDKESKLGNSPNDLSQPDVLKGQKIRRHGAEVLEDGAGKTEVIRDRVNGNSMEMDTNIKRLLNNDYFIHQSNSNPFMGSRGNFMKTGRQDMLVHGDDLCDPSDFGVNLESRKIDLKSFIMEQSSSLQEEQTPKASNEAYMPSYTKKKSKNVSSSFDLEERMDNSKDPSTVKNSQTANEMEEDSASPSSVISDDLLFDRHLTEATNLLKQARKCLSGQVDEERAEVLLFKSERLLTRAITMKPMSLLAMGQLGNAYLLHGELKLRTARELRTLLSRSDSLPRDKSGRIRVKGFDNQAVSRDKIASRLIDICEECEELLVEAGRKYKMALSIDGGDVRALYNWGLALSYRAQLIADIGPGAAADADRVYMAAIDKFDAMMSRSNACAPDALFRWGVALQQRSRLRPSNSKEKTKLLNQAKRLFEDVLSMDSTNFRVREALSSCVYELNHTDSGY